MVRYARTVRRGVGRKISKEGTKEKRPKNNSIEPLLGWRVRGQRKKDRKIAKNTEK